MNDVSTNYKIQEESLECDFLNFIKNEENKKSKN